ncbi:MAG: DNA helicase [Candidatus Wallbacteria bacterium HGW-Wallbacteria-1]|uniref:DNA 3'-5' helicase n=1 Tax=Candidatus Wallbacteria bacterium HGW-Wallbacteria-1 TaxID=2013854 RepID=A0A2N1PVK6_9BACT|nr:MAG: DNA helicase [Candidatus Wallbacteria bacterium HGW-Wallbacteria-1]
MQLRIADTFLDSLGRLNNEEQKAAKMTAFDLQLNPTTPGLQLHKLDAAKDKNFWSARVSSDLRMILHRTDNSMLICYVGHHDDAYKWAEKRKLETHPTTGAVQLVEIREQIKNVTILRYIDAEQETKPRIFENFSKEDLLKYGVPEEWIDDVMAANDDTILELADHLPKEAGEALLALAVGSKPDISVLAEPGSDPYEHPDTKRRIRTVENSDDLAMALDFPWEKWTIFLHPAQMQTVEKNYGGPTRISGSAGTGKTIVALHRAVYLARTNPDTRVLITTFSTVLAEALKIKLRRLIRNEPRLGERIEVHSINSIGMKLYTSHFGKPKIVDNKTLHEIIRDASAKVADHKFSHGFLITEWEQVIDPWQLESWEAYRDFIRLGRKTRLPEQQRKLAWEIFKKIMAELKNLKLITWAEIFNKLTSTMECNQNRPFDFYIVDEAQDIDVYQLRFMATMGTDRPDALFFTGDLGQRIFQQPYSWKSLGVDIRGRSRTLKINYRTSHQIRNLADRLLGPEITDVDGNCENRKGTVSVFNGPAPVFFIGNSKKDETEFVAKWIIERIDEGMKPEEIGIFVRSGDQMNRAINSLELTGLPYKRLDEKFELFQGQLPLCTMHLAKGLEFRAIAVMACDDEILPLQKRIESITEESDLLDAYESERHLLYVACTRARDCLLVTSAENPSEFLDDMRVE